MPKLNMNHPEVADYMLGVAKYWIREAGIDGWRLDVANEVHPLFWSRFRRELKDEFPELLLIGEIMHASGPWLRGDQFDGGMNYVLRDAVLEFLRNNPRARSGSWSRCSISKHSAMIRLTRQCSSCLAAMIPSGF